MDQGVFGLATGTFVIVVGVPVIITALLLYWGISFDSRFPETVEKKKTPGGAKGRTK